MLLQTKKLCKQFGGMYALKDIDFEIAEDRITVRASDIGPGIPDIDKAMTEGWSTATNEVRNMGFGAGMGLPNMKRNADGFDIVSAVGVGTHITMTFDI